jgi:type I restriction enzyme, S subunit
MLQQLIIDHIDLWTCAETSRSKAGRGSNGKTELTGIKKLRELILELAVRGLLVPQDPSDEPASVLLEKIAAEKEVLIKAGKIKKQKPLPEINKDEKPFDLPIGWEWTRLGNTGIGSTGKTPSTKNAESFTGEIPFIGPGQITPNGELLEPDKFLSEKGLLESTEAVRGDIFMVCIGGSIGKSIIANQRLAFNQQINALKPIFIISKYLLIAVSSPHFYASIIENSTGSATPIINRLKWEALLVPLPPLREQHRIVANVDELMALCDQLEQQQLQHSDTHHTLVTTLLDSLSQATDNAQFQTIWSQLAVHFDTLFTTEASIDQLKQTLLQLAVMGKLVPQDPNDEPASVLLEKIAAEKEALIKAGKIKKQKPLPEITDDEKAFELPNGWEWAKMGGVLKKITDGTHHSPTNCDSGEYLYISAKNIKPEGVLISNATYVTKETHEEIYTRCDPEYGDLLYIKDGATTGIVTINTLKEPFSMLSSVALLKVPNSVLNSYLLLSLMSPFFYAEMRAEMTGVAITRVTLKKLNEAVITLPPLREQHRIVAKVDELMALCDQLKAGINQAQTTQQQLAHALVEQAIH